jgi:zinc protease
LKDESLTAHLSWQGRTVNHRSCAFRSRTTLGLALTLLLPSAAEAAPPAPPASPAAASAPATTPAPAPAAKPLEIPFEKFTLENGLSVILHRDPSLPLVAVNLWYHVGPANEPRGRSGFAHLFEHLMFEGSKHVGREFDKLLESVGATNVNGTTNWDRTNYFETVPREQLALALWIESDRMGFLLDVVTQERLDIQRDVVKNERRQSYENAPYGPSSLALLDAMFPAGHPYHGAVIGSMEDLSAATLDDVREFFRSYYAPSNATLALAGDFDPTEVKALVKRYFGGLAGRPVTRAPKVATPPLTKPVRLVIDEPVELARVAHGYIAPPAFGRDDAALEVAMAVLAGGRSTRLYRSLVVDQKVAADVDAGVDSNALASMVSVEATVATGKSVEVAEAALDKVLDELSAKAPTPVEVARAKHRIRFALASDVELLNGRGGESGRAGLLQRFNHYLGDPGYLPQWLSQLDAVTPEDVRRVIATHLGKNARVTVVTRPKTAKGAP